MFSLHRIRWFAFAAATVAVSVPGVHAGDTEVAADDTIAAIWKIERIEFPYHSTTVRYRCANLRRRIAEILHAVGAYPQMAVDLGCRSGELVRHATVQLTLAVPVEATEENVQAATDFDARDELIARLRHTQLPTANDLPRFPASWRTVALTRKPPLSLGPGDCDLLRAMRDHVFPQLRVRVISSGLQCGGGADTRITPRIHVDALLPSRT